MLNSKILFIGGGRVVNFMLQGWANSNIPLDNITVFDPDANVNAELKRKFGIQTAGSIDSNIKEFSTIVIAVHPPVIKSVLDSIKDYVDENTLIISLAPKFTIQVISEGLNKHKKIVRTIPSAASIINEGLNPICFSTSVTTQEQEKVFSAFKYLGQVPLVAEAKLEAYAMIVAMGPTYMWFQWHTLHQLAEQFGMDADEAVSAVKVMTDTSLKTLFNSGLLYEQVQDLVPVKPLGDTQEKIIDFYNTKLPELFNKIKTK